MIQEETLEFARCPNIRSISKPPMVGWHGRLARLVGTVDCHDWLTRHNIRCAVLSRHNIRCAMLSGERVSVNPVTVALKGSDCAGGKKIKERLTVEVCINAVDVDDFNKPLKPRCFENVSPSHLLVMWIGNRKAWMTGDFLKEWVTNFNQKMCSERRNVLLILDNAPSHTQNLELSNVTLQFLPANTTSAL